jgi:hypothetical protein
MSLSIIGLLLTNTASAGDAALPAPDASALVQTWVTLADQDESDIADPGGYGDPEDDTGVKLRRVRLGLKGGDDTVKYSVRVGMASAYDVVEEAQGYDAGLGLVDTYVGYAPVKGLWVVGGLQKVPVSREALMSSGNLTFTDRAVSTHWLTPGHDLGLVVDGRWEFLRARLGVFNGSGDLTGDDNDGKLFAARVEGKLGEGAVYRTGGTVDDFTMAIGVDGWTNNETAISSTGYGADLIVRLEGLTVLAEARQVVSEPKEDLVMVPGVFAETTRQGVMTQVGYSIGSFEPALRYSILDDDMDVEDVGDVAEGMAGVTWHGDDGRFRAGTGYAYRMERGGQPVTNDTVRMWLQLKL